ncbi:hypothetical protein CLOM_g20116 [Closterium sp. NIES-68]|nr:hypothetical protein CLOM_g20116 [Closterium sp. NIES-68]GJP64135.1 hypothetical protein CLOP_g21156 [Closterium sp. NIES-67]
MAPAVASSALFAATSAVPCSLVSLSHATSCRPSHASTVAECGLSPTRCGSSAASSTRATSHLHSEFVASRSEIARRVTRSDSRRTRSSRTTTPSCSLPSLEETPATPVFASDGAVAAFPAASGIYAIYDTAGALQYMGLSRRLAASLQAHAEDLPEMCGAVKLVVVAATDKAALVDAWKAWMQEHVAGTGKVPPGNESGNTTWTTRRAKRVKPDLRIVPGPHVKLTIPLTELIDKLVKENRVVAFIKGTRISPQCGFSHRVLTLLNEARVDYETLNVLDEDHNPGLREAIKEYSQWPTIPQIFVNGEFIGGADILEEMAQSGELKQALAAPQQQTASA